MTTARLLRVWALLLLCVALLGATSVSAAPSAPSAPLPPGPWVPWPSATSTVPGPLFAVATNTVNDAWSVGAGGRVNHYNGQGWLSVTSPVTQALESVYPVAANLALVVGLALPSDNKPAVLTCTPARCTRDTTVPPVGGLDSIWAVSSTDYWAVGGSGNTPGAESGTILHFTGGAWSPNLATGTAATVHLHNIQMLSATEGWAVGESPTPGGAGTIFHYTGGTWQPVTTGVAFTGPLYSLWFVSPTEGWVVGGELSPTPVILHYRATATPQWTAETVTSLGAPTTLLWYVNMRADGSGFASGNNGQILYRDPTLGTWASVYSDTRPPLAPFYGVWVAPGATLGWAVGGDEPTGMGVMARFGTPTTTWLPIVQKQ